MRYNGSIRTNPWSRVLLERPPDMYPLKHVPEFMESLSSLPHSQDPSNGLFWVRLIQSIPHRPISPRSIFTTHARLGLPSGLFPSSLPTNNPHAFPLLPHSYYMPWPSFPPWPFKLYLAEGTHYEVPFSAVFSTLPSPHPSSVRIFSSETSSQHSQSTLLP
jgi:hypothetical protein